MYGFKKELNAYLDDAGIDYFVKPKKSSLKRNNKIKNILIKLKTQLELSIHQWEIKDENSKRIFRLLYK